MFVYQRVSPVSRSKDSLLQVHALWLEVLRFNGPAPFEITDRSVEPFGDRNGVHLPSISIFRENMMISLISDVKP